MLMQRQWGFTLLEMVIAMALGAIMLLSMAQSWPALWQSSQMMLRQYRLESALQQALQPLMKDLHRAGFCAGQCARSGWRLSAYPGESSHSCILLSYDLNHNGVIEADEWFAYRLREAGLEGQRSVTQCDGAGWQRLLDQREIVVTLLQITPQPGQQSTLIHLRLMAHWRQWPHIHAAIEHWVVIENG